MEDLRIPLKGYTLNEPSVFSKGDRQMRKIVEFVRRGAVAGGASAW
jgi:hypothetical protein